jgi:general secretion pathway protein B
MSFILDALKKSETDRQQKSTAEFTAVPTSAPPPSFPRWIWIVGALLAVNLLVLVFVLLRPDPIIAAPERITNIPVPTPTVSSEKLEPPPPSSFQEKVTAARENAPPRQQPVIEMVTPPPAGRVQVDLISQNPSLVAASDLYPSIHEMRAKGRLNIPDLHLDIHVYNDNPEDRFVFINMTKHREGSQLEEGPVVAEIVPEGVVLGHEGQFFLLPRE